MMVFEVANAKGTEMAEVIEVNTAHGPRFLGEKEVEEVTGGAIKIRSLQSWRQRGGGPPFYKFGRKVVYREDELQAWMNEQRRASTSDYGQTAA
jgi:hypothetical protein